MRSTPPSPSRNGACDCSPPFARGISDAFREECEERRDNEDSPEWKEEGVTKISFLSIFSQSKFPSRNSTSPANLTCPSCPAHAPLVGPPSRLRMELWFRFPGVLNQVRAPHLVVGVGNTPPLRSLFSAERFPNAAITTHDSIHNRPNGASINPTQH